MNNNENLILNIKNHNWGLIGPGTWKEKQWNIYDDMSVDYTITYNSPTGDKNVSEFELSKEEFDTIINNIGLAKSDNTVIEASDGEAWEFVEYNNGEENWKRPMGYIYGITSLEKITDILRGGSNNE